MVSISRNTVAYALINFAFWGFLGAQAYSALNYGIQNALSAHTPIGLIPSILPKYIIPGTISHVDNFVGYAGSAASLYGTMVFFLVGFGISMIFTRRNIMIGIAGFGAAILNLIMVITGWAFIQTSVPGLILQDAAAILLYMGLASWMLSNVEYKSNPYQSLALSGWGGIIIAIVMGSLMQANIVYYGVNSYEWAFIFAYCVLFMFGIGGLLLKKEKLKIEDKAIIAPLK
jgi:hypothetical protein